MNNSEASYSAVPRRISVSKEKFEEFIKNYPNPLEKIEAPYDGRMYVWYDDKLLDDNEPHNRVANCSFPETGIITDGLCHYYVLINYKECFDSKN